MLTYSPGFLSAGFWVFVRSTIGLAAMAACGTNARAADFEDLFNGKDLTGWEGVAGFWSVEDGVIVGESTPDRVVNPNTFLVWQGGEVEDFEFTASVRFRGNNSGIQYRSELTDEAAMSLKGYQMDLHPSPNYFGMLYGEKYGKRGIIAKRGQEIVISDDGTVTETGRVGDAEELVDWKWNRIRIVAVGDRLLHQVNGVTTVMVTDRDPSAMSAGSLGIQLHRGAPMRVEIRSPRLRRLSGAAGERRMSRLLKAGKAAGNESSGGRKPVPSPSPSAAEAETTGCQ